MDLAEWTASVYPDFRQPEGAPAVWELFHENSKTTRYSKFPEPNVVAERMRAMHASITHPTLPAVELPAPAGLARPLGETIAGRRSGRSLSGGGVSLSEVSALLHSGYGITQADAPGRPFRATPSGGALYPIELYLFAPGSPEIEEGLYHYEPERHLLRRLGTGMPEGGIAPLFVQEELVRDAALVLLFTAVFERSVFKYGERGYRFALIEAGHIAQNISLAATALGCESVSLGGYFDHEVDELLELDGVSQSTLYALAIGGSAK